MRTFPGLRRDALKVAAVACALGLAGPVWAAKHVIKVSHAVTVNHPGLTEWSVPVLGRIAGEANVAVVSKICGSEDFSCFQKEVPGFFYFMGCTPPDRDARTAAPNHSPRFYVDENCLKLGVKTLSVLALDWLAANAK